MAHVIIATDLGYGDSGMGSTIDALARRKKGALVVRYCGGSYVQHNVLTKEGVHHTFASFGSGTLAGSATYLGPEVFVHPRSVLEEAVVLQRTSITDPLSLMYIDAKAPLLTPFNAAVSQTREFMRRTRHGTSGMGVYETNLDRQLLRDGALIAGDMLDLPNAKAKLVLLRERKFKLLYAEFPELFGAAVDPRTAQIFHLFTENAAIEMMLEEYAELAQRAHICDASVVGDALSLGNDVLFEGAQGVLLDERIGFLPYVAGSSLLPELANDLLAANGSGEKPYVLGLVRAYTTRHGAGPLVTEDAFLSSRIIEEHNSSSNLWQGPFRMGWFDAIMTRYAINAIGGVDGLAVSCIDQAASLPRYQYAAAYQDKKGHLISELLSQQLKDEQERSLATAQLFEMQPIYKSSVPKKEEITDAIKESCAATIAIISEGKTAAGKEFRVEL